MEDFGYIKTNYENLLKEIKELTDARGGGEVRLVCVTKSGSDEELIALAAAGALEIGENRPGELSRRGALLSEHGFTPKLHEIGNLQRNKVKLIVDKASLIHSLDSVGLALEIEKQATKLGVTVPVLVEVNSAREENKGGVMPEDAESFCRLVKEYPHLELKGLMTMGPVCENPEDIRPYFKTTKEIFDRLSAEGVFSGEPILSMGMSDSYAVAIQEGSTLVRVGRKLFSKQEKEI